MRPTFHQHLRRQQLRIRQLLSAQEGESHRLPQLLLPRPLESIRIRSYSQVVAYLLSWSEGLSDRHFRSIRLLRLSGFAEHRREEAHRLPRQLLDNQLQHSQELPQEHRVQQLQHQVTSGVIQRGISDGLSQNLFHSKWLLLHRMLRSRKSSGRGISLWQGFQMHRLSGLRWYRRYRELMQQD